MFDAIEGKPQNPASIKTLGKPSELLAITRIFEEFIYFAIFFCSISPKKITLFCNFIFLTMSFIFA